MAIKDVITLGLGPSSVNFIPTVGYAIGVTTVPASTLSRYRPRTSSSASDSYRTTVSETSRYLKTNDDD